MRYVTEYYALLHMKQIKNSTIEYMLNIMSYEILVNKKNKKTGFLYRSEYFDCLLMSLLICICVIIKLCTKNLNSYNLRKIDKRTINKILLFDNALIIINQIIINNKSY